MISYNNIMPGERVELSEMLLARENRANRQQELLKEYAHALISFTMNIAGPVKNNDLIGRAFNEGCDLLACTLKANKIGILKEIRISEKTGNEYFAVIDVETERKLMLVKHLLTEIEDETELGRLFDLDLLCPDGRQISRVAINKEERSCLICGKSGRICARMRTHTVEELQQKTLEILTRSFEESDRQMLSSLAVRSLLYEVATTPKPGLVDCRNNGSHKDMNLYTFINSATSLYPYFDACARIGAATRDLPPDETFKQIRRAGKHAERTMMLSTDGVNTHKGAIFSLGILTAAAARHTWQDRRSPEKVLATCSAMTSGLISRDLSNVTSADASTTGQKLYAEYGITGVRGEAQAGFPTVLHAGLPVLERGLERGLSENEAGCGALLAILSAGIDTNMIARSDVETAAAYTEKVKQLIAEDPYPARDLLESLDDAFIEKNLSPGGSADLLAMTWFLYKLKHA